MSQESFHGLHPNAATCLVLWRPSETLFIPLLGIRIAVTKSKQKLSHDLDTADVCARLACPLLPTVAFWLGRLFDALHTALLGTRITITGEEKSSRYALNTEVVVCAALSINSKSCCPTWLQHPSEHFQILSLAQDQHHESSPSSCFFVQSCVRCWAPRSS